MMDKKRAVYQGTFDPFTGGHLSVLRVARALFDEVVVLLLVNPAKQPLFSLPERLEMVRRAVADLPGVTADSAEGLLVEYMRPRGITFCVRGVRNAQDAAYELKNHSLSQALYPPLQTLLLPCAPQWQAVSSSAVKAACALGRLPRAWVPQAVARKLQEKYPELILF